MPGSWGHVYKALPTPNPLLLTTPTLTKNSISTSFSWLTNLLTLSALSFWNLFIRNLHKSSSTVWKSSPSQKKTGVKVGNLTDFYSYFYFQALYWDISALFRPTFLNKTPSLGLYSRLHNDIVEPSYWTFWQIMQTFFLVSTLQATLAYPIIRSYNTS